jgi:hypothetical protein
LKPIRRKHSYLQIVRYRWLGWIPAGVLVVCSPDVWASNPDLGVTQYAHTTWRVHDGSPKTAQEIFGSRTKNMVFFA